MTFIGNSLWSACDQTMIQIDLIMYWPKWFLHKSQTQNAICRGENIMTFFMVFWWKKSGGTVMKHIRHCMTYQYLVLKLIIRCHRSVLITILATISAWIKKNGEKTPVIVYINFKSFWFFSLFESSRKWNCTRWSMKSSSP